MASTLFIDWEDKHNIKNNNQNNGILKIHITKLQVKKLINHHLINDIANIVIEYYDDDNIPITLTYVKYVNNDVISYFFKSPKYTFKINCFDNQINNIYINLYSNIVYKKNNDHIKHYYDFNKSIFLDYFMSDVHNKEWKLWKNYKMSVDFINFYMKTFHSIHNFINYNYETKYEYMNEKNNNIKMTDKENGDVIIRKIIDYKYLNTLFCMIKLTFDLINNNEKNGK